MQAVLIKCICLVVFLVININPAAAAGECGKSSPDAKFRKVYLPCLSALKSPYKAVGFCCNTLARELLGQTPACLCAVLLSNTAKSVGVKPEVALTIPTRCNFAKCGG